MAESKTNIYQRLAEVQAELNAPKNRYNKHGSFNYRSAEDILEAVKPLNKKHGLTLVVSDELVHFPSDHELQVIEVVNTKGEKSTEVIGGDRFYIKATATVYDGEGNSIPATAFARETQNKKGMDDSQVTGSTSSYARKYALNGLYNIDDTKDADTDEHHNQTASSASRPVSRPAASQPAPRPTDASAHREFNDNSVYPCEAPGCGETQTGSFARTCNYKFGRVYCQKHWGMAKKGDLDPKENVPPESVTDAYGDNKQLPF